MWTKIFVISEKNLRNFIRYKLDFIFYLITPVLSIIPILLEGYSFTNGQTSKNFIRSAGTANYISFILLGVLFFNVILSSLWGLASGLRWELEAGTLETLWLAPVNKFELIVGLSLSEILISYLNIIFQFLVYEPFLHIHVTIITPIFFIIILFFLNAGMYSIGLILSGILLLMKEADSLISLMEQILNLFTPVKYGLNSLPPIVRVISTIIPFTIGITLIRQIFLEQPLTLSIQFFFNLFFLITLCICYLFIGKKLFIRFENKTKVNNSLGGY